MIAVLMLCGLSEAFGTVGKVGMVGMVGMGMAVCTGIRLGRLVSCLMKEKKCGRVGKSRKTMNSNAIRESSFDVRSSQFAVRCKVR